MNGLRKLSGDELKIQEIQMLALLKQDFISHNIEVHEDKINFVNKLNLIHGGQKEIFLQAIQDNKI